jgi:hypothetical protein
MRSHYQVNDTYQDKQLFPLRISIGYSLTTINFFSFWNTMADQEIAKHTKKVIQLLGQKEHGWRHRVAEMTQEILIIVFAVSLSIWLHGLVEHHHEQQEVKTFLLGLREDVQNDIGLIKSVTEADQTLDANYKYLAGLQAGQRVDTARFDPAYAMLDSNLFFKPRNSRFDGFKSSGKLNNIEEANLLNNILTLYQERFPQIASSQGFWSNSQDHIRNYLEQGLVGDDGLAERYALIVAPKGKRLLRRAVAVPQLYARYQNYTTLATAIVAQIDQLYPPAHAAKPG